MFYYNYANVSNYIQFNMLYFLNLSGEIVISKKVMQIWNNKNHCFGWKI